MQKRAAVIGGEYVEWYEDCGPGRVSHERELLHGAATHAAGSRRGNAISGWRIVTPEVVVGDKARVECCGLVLALREVCPRCFKVAWIKDRADD